MLWLQVEVTEARDVEDSELRPEQSFQPILNGGGVDAGVLHMNRGLHSARQQHMAETVTWEIAGMRRTHQIDMFKDVQQHVDGQCTALELFLTRRKDVHRYLGLHRAKAILHT